MYQPWYLKSHWGGSHLAPTASIRRAAEPGGATTRHIQPDADRVVTPSVVSRESGELREEVGVRCAHPGVKPGGTATSVNCEPLHVLFQRNCYFALKCQDHPDLVMGGIIRPALMMPARHVLVCNLQGSCCHSGKPLEVAPWEAQVEKALLLASKIPNQIVLFFNGCPWINLLCCESLGRIAKQLRSMER